jgi:hypothetical protein
MPRSRSSRNGRQVFREVLSSLLLAVIVGAATHQHASIAPSCSAEAALQSSNIANTSLAGIQTDCSICKLHSQLSATSIDKAEPVELPFIRIELRPATLSTYRSQRVLRTRGRAPPLTSPV